MLNTETICNVSSLIPLFAPLFSFIYGLGHFFKRGKPLFLQTITMAMGSYVLGSVYHLCQALTNETPTDGFTPAYLGRIGFYLFILTASYGHLDRIIDDGSSPMKKSRYISLVAPIFVSLLFVPNYIADVSLQTKISYALVWIPAVFAVYFNLKHAIIPDLDFGFIKAIKPYNRFTLCLSFCELLRLTSYNYNYIVPRAIFSVVFGILCVCTVVSAKKGAEKWTV
jgi:hypothetical protein